MIAIVHPPLVHYLDALAAWTMSMLHAIATPEGQWSFFTSRAMGMAGGQLATIACKQPPQKGGESCASMASMCLLYGLFVVFVASPPGAHACC